jgi:hypothetical protein
VILDVMIVMVVIVAVMVAVMVVVIVAVVVVVVVVSRHRSQHYQHLRHRDCLCQKGWFRETDRETEHTPTSPAKKKEHKQHCFLELQEIHHRNTFCSLAATTHSEQQQQ